MKNIWMRHRFDYYVLLFFILAAAGWLWEVTLYYATGHGFVNRGIYKGPYLPIYGAGGIALTMLLWRCRKKPFRVFLLSALICSLLEYFTSWFLESIWNVRWWDYSGHFLNINGRICLLGCAAFGLGGMAFVCFLLPVYGKLYDKLPSGLRLFLCGILLLLFAADGAYGAMRPNLGFGISE